MTNKRNFNNTIIPVLKDKQFLVTDGDRNSETFWRKSLLYEYHKDILQDRKTTHLWSTIVSFKLSK